MTVLAQSDPDASDPGTASSVNLTPLEVTATRSRTLSGRTPQKVTVIPREDIEQQLLVTQDRGQALSNLIPSYSPSRQKLTNSGESFRGRSPLYLVDGVPQSNPIRDSARDSYTIDLSMVERIEVIHGASAEHGLGATGGIINFVTRRPEAGESNQRISASVTMPYSPESAGLGHKLGYQTSGQQGDWDYVGGVTRQSRGIFFDGNGERIGLDPLQGDVQDSTSYDLFGKLGYWLDADQNLELSLNHFELNGNGNFHMVEGDRAGDEPTTARRGAPDGQLPYNRVATVNLSYAHADWRGNEVDAQLYHQRFRALFGASPYFPYQDADGNERLDQSQNQSDKLGGKLTLRRDDLVDGRLSLATGIDVVQDETQQRLVETDRAYVPETLFHNYAAFIQSDYALLDPLTLHAGVRYEYAELDVDTYQTIDRSNVTQDNVTVQGGTPSFDETLFNAGLVYQVTEAFQLFGNYSEGFGMPDVGRALRGISDPGQDVDSLIELKPILTDNIEVGTRFDWQPVSFELSYYESNSDLGERLTQENGVFVGSREKTEIQGVEFSGSVQVNEAHSLDMSYARNQGESDTDGDGRVDAELTGMNVAPERVSLGWRASWSDRLSTRLFINHYVDRDFDDQTNPNLDSFDGYNLVDATLAYRLPAGTMSVGVENLLDEDYYTYYSQTARDGDDQYFKGRGRTITVGYQLEF